jgi:ubiquinone/menaquinone biosynthesis C-methylase UbiE
MSPLRDPERVEARKLIISGQFASKMALEIGCGSADITWQYAGIASKVFGIDPSFPDLQKAHHSQLIAITNVSLAQTIGEALPFPSGTFDIAVFSSSL